MVESCWGSRPTGQPRRAKWSGPLTRALGHGIVCEPRRLESEAPGLLRGFGSPVANRNGSFSEYLANYRVNYRAGSIGALVRLLESPCPLTYNGGW